MKLLTSRELARATNLNIPGGIIIAKALMQIFRYNKLNKVYTSSYDKDPIVFINSILDHLDIKYEVPEKDLENVPLEGPCITVSNHPFGGIDALILLKLITARRDDVKGMANFLLQKIDPLKDYILPVNPFETHKEVKSSFKGIKEGLNYLKEGHLVAIFPAGEVSTYQTESNVIIDREWQASALKFIKMAEVPVIPVYFHGTNSRWFHILGRVHPLLRTAKLASELFNKRNKNIRIRIGKPITVREQSEFHDIARYGRYLRARTYSLGSTLEAKKFFQNRNERSSEKKVPVADPGDREQLRQEFLKVRQGHELFTSKNYSVIFASTHTIPHIFEEIGRLREITFRAAGEGTNRSTDVDEFDFYYHHLVVWDTDTDTVVGAYRIGKGKEILNQYGIKGFYISTLFRISNRFAPYLGESIELGRSFIVDEYQRKALPLFLLWKGLLTVLLENTDYRYLIGPVSISNDFSGFSKSLIVEFIKNNYFDADMGEFIKPRKKFNIQVDKRVDSRIFIDSAEKDISKVEKIVSDVDSGYRIPVLLKKYLEINGKIIGFNVDPDFNNCLDGLIMLDVYNLPPDFVKALSKDMSEENLRKRFENPQ
ncbi:MAG TPA: lysophospholipid acyltransferase family protein [Bacteroidales bacterium]|nr:lysophospholipid acyltransferase family protein [Bacteroidales bacterium]